MKRMKVKRIRINEGTSKQKVFPNGGMERERVRGRGWV